METTSIDFVDMTRHQGSRLLRIVDSHLAKAAPLLLALELFANPLIHRALQI